MRQTGDAYWQQLFVAVRSDEDGAAGGLPPPPSARRDGRLHDSDLPADRCRRGPGAEGTRTGRPRLTRHRSLLSSPASDGKRKEARIVECSAAAPWGRDGLLGARGRTGGGDRLPERARQRLRAGRHPHHPRQPAHSVARERPRVVRVVVLGPGGDTGAVPAAGARQLRGELRGARPVDLRLYGRQHRPARGRVTPALRARARHRRVARSPRARRGSHSRFTRCTPRRSRESRGARSCWPLSSSSSRCTSTGWRPARAGRAMGYRAAVVACFAGALLSKETAMTLVLVLPVMDALFPTKDGAGQLAVTARSTRHRLSAARGRGSCLPRGAPCRARRHPHRRRSHRAPRQSHGADHDDGTRREAGRDAWPGAHDRLRSGRPVRPAPRVAGTPLAGLLVQPDSARDQRARCPLHGRRGHGSGVRLRDSWCCGAAAPWQHSAWRSSR